MNLLIISSSQRKQSQSKKVALYLQQQASEFKNVTTIDLCDFDIPLWDGENKGSDWKHISKSLMQADAILLITPEWNGTASPLLKNFLLMCSHEETAYKPVLLVSVSSGIGGSYPIAELKMNAFKNNKMTPTPDHLIIRFVENMLNSEVNDEHDKNLRSRIRYSLHTLSLYATSLYQVRAHLRDFPTPEQHRFSYGM
ncbi:MAG: NADPH-dependent FMN reductase [Parashewanella sp.]